MGKRADRRDARLEEERLRQELDSASQWLAVLRQRGFTLWRDGDMLVIRPASLLTDDLRAILRELKPALLTLLLIDQFAPATLPRPRAK